MQDTLLSTKLNIPQVSQKVVHRPRLIERLNQGLNEGAKLTLVSAPAGYGKTTLVTEWLAEMSAADPAPYTAWLSLDKSDNETSLFVSYLIAAMQRIDPSIGAELRPILETDADLPVEPMLTSLVNAVAGRGSNIRNEKRFVLVLDDYHLITEFGIHEALDFLVDHIPPHLHLVIMTRVDPPMPLGRLRVQRALLEIREVDLQFNLDEATTFLNRLMSLDLSVENVKVLEDRTEGWIAGLQLAALTLQGRTDKQRLVKAYSGSHRHLIDYLAHEVLSRQSAEVQSFLIRTSILDRFNASLCDRVLEHRESARILKYLEQVNLFLVPLDDERQWYRYHHLFADFLRQQLHESEPEINTALLSRASNWYEARDKVDEAIEYAFSSGDVKRAARLVDENAERLILIYADIAKMLRWAARIPEKVRAKFPRLCIYHAWALQFEYQLEIVEQTIALAEENLSEPASLPESFSADQISGHANAIRSYVAFRKGEYENSVELSIATLETLPEENTQEVLLLRGALMLGLGMSYRQLDDLETSHLFTQRALPMNQKAGNRYAALSCITEIVGINVARGALNQVVDDTDKGLFWIEEWSRMEGRKSRSGRMLANFRRALGLVQYERNELDQAAVNLNKASDYYELTQSWLRLQNYGYLVDLYHALGDVEKTLSYYGKLKRFCFRPGLALPGIPIGALLAQHSLMLSQTLPDQQDLQAEAVRWADNSDLEPTDIFLFKQEYEYCTLARVLIAQNRAIEANPLLDRLIRSAERAGRNGDLILYSSIQATAHHGLGNSNLALDYLSRAMTLAEPEGYIRTFADLGQPMADLLKIMVKNGIYPIYSSRLLAAFPTTVEKSTSAPPNTRHDIRQATVPLIEPFNDRERHILRLMSAMLSNREIANELYLSVNTVKWYARQIYEKLGVANRREAVGHARELGLL
jgi:LuxR family maltose regulon positive regulatory protein